MSPEKRRKTFLEIEEVMPEKTAVKESKRCMECGCIDVYECKLKKYSEDYGCVENMYAGDIKIYQIDSSSDYLYRDPSKCVLCGRCVRLCSEKVHVGVYGYVARGFDSIIQPPFSKTVSDSNCIACGTCISGCPVGAIVPNKKGKKLVPLKGEAVDSSCYHCSIGCSNSIETLTDSIFEVNEVYYLCKKGRFQFPENVDASGSKAVWADVKKYNDAVVYPSASLSAEDYEGLKLTSEKMGWKLANYYSQSTLWQAFASAKKLPRMDFFTDPVKEKSLVIVCGKIEFINPVALNRLSDVILKDTKIVHLNKQTTIRLKSMDAELVKTPDEMKKIDLSAYNEVILLINPIDFDQIYGENSALSLYNELCKKTGSLRTTLLSESRNLYSFMDADQTPDHSGKREIFIHSVPKGHLSVQDTNSLIVMENGKEVYKVQLGYSHQNQGSYLNSRKKLYKNTPVFKTDVLSDLLTSVYSVSGKVKEISYMEQEKPLENQKVKVVSFPEDSFIKRFSGV